MASVAGIARKIVLNFPNGEINETTVLSNSVFQSIVNLTLPVAAYMKYSNSQVWNSINNSFAFLPVLEVTLISTAANDATIVSDLPTLQSSLGLTGVSIPTWSWSTTWSY